jgi:O-antigen ligase
MNSRRSSRLTAIAEGPSGLLRGPLGVARAHPMFWLGLLIPLTTTVYGQDNVPLINIPPIIPISAVFVLVALVRGGVEQVVGTWKASPAAFWLYASVCAVEVFLMFYHRNPRAWAWVGGRAMFFTVLLTAVALCDDVDAARQALRGLTFGVGVISLLTLIHALQVVYLPFGLPLEPSRTFGPFRVPLPRTLGLAMSRNRFGILAAASLATVVASSLADGPRIGPWWARAVLVSLVLAAGAITQTRGVYLTMSLAMGLSLLLRLARQSARRWFTGSRGALCVVAGYFVLLVLANVIFIEVVPPWLVDLGAAEDVYSVASRTQLNAVAWLSFLRAPLLGVGHGTVIHTTYEDVYVHNHFLEQLMSTGVVGSVPYLLFHFWVLFTAVRLLASPQPSSRAVAMALVVSVAATYLAYQFFLSFFTPTFALLCGLVLSVQRQELASVGRGRAKRSGHQEDA